MLGGVDNHLFFMSLAGFPVVLFLIFMLRWTSARGKSVVARKSKPGREDEYGTLVAVASPSNHIEGEMLRQKLVAVGIKATLTQTKDGPRIFVFPKEESAARAHLRSVN
jgi:endonuclease YncB( thermonuclease family)